MKQLLLNFLLIFGSAYFFLQCAQLLTSNDKTAVQHALDPAIISKVINSQNKVAGPVFMFSNTKFNFQDNPVEQFFEKSSSLNMTGYFGIQTLFYYPNINFTSFDLFHKYPKMLKRGKSK